MSRKITIDKYQGNTHYSIHVIDSFGQEHHLGYQFKQVDLQYIEEQACEIWANEVKPKEDLLENAIVDCKEIHSKNNNLREI